MAKYVFSFTFSGRRDESEADRRVRHGKAYLDAFRVLNRFGYAWSVFQSVMFFTSDHTRAEMIDILRPLLSEGDTFFLVSFDEPDAASFIGWLPNADECERLFTVIEDLN